jgi:hypothetical protein
MINRDIFFMFPLCSFPPYASKNLTSRCSGACVKGVLVELRSTKIHGCDVGAPLNMYRWAPEMAPIDLRTTSFKQLSDEFEVTAALPSAQTSDVQTC